MGNSKSKIKIFFIMGGLGYGGIERQLLNHFSLMDLSKFKPQVLCMSLDGYKIEMEKELENMGISIIKPSKKTSLSKLLLAIKSIYRFKPDVIYSSHFYTNI